MTVVAQSQEPDWLKYFPAELDPFTVAALILGEHDFNFFCKYFFGINLAEFQDEVAQVIFDPVNDRVLIVMPRDNGKSTIMEIYATHRMVYNPGKFCMFAGSIYEQAMERTENVREIFETIYPFYYLAQPNNKNWAKTRFLLLNRSKLAGMGAGKQVAGARRGKERPSLIINDDIVPQSDRTALTDDEVFKWFMETISNLGSSTGTQIIVVGTPYRETDIIATLRKNERYKVLIYESLLGQDVEALWRDDTKVLFPERWPLEALRNKFKEVGSLIFTRNYLCRMVSSATSLFPRDLLEKYMDLELDFVFRRPANIKYVIGGWDLARDPHGDWTVLGAVGITEDKKWRLLNARRLRGLSYKQQVSLAREFDNYFDFDLLVVEVNQFQDLIAQLVIDESFIPIHKHTTTAQKHDLEKGVPRVRQHLENGRWIFPSTKKPSSREFMEILFSEMVAMYVDPKDGKVKTNAKHDDTPMFMYLVTIGLERFGSGMFRSIGSI